MQPVFINYRDDETSKHFKKSYDYTVEDTESCFDMISGLDRYSFPVTVSDSVEECLVATTAVKVSFPESVLIMVAHDAHVAKIRTRFSDTNTVLLGYDDNEQSRTEIGVSDIFRISSKKMDSLKWEVLDLVCRYVEGKKISVVVSGDVFDKIDDKLLNTLMSMLKGSIVSMGFCNNVSEDARGKAKIGDQFRQILGTVVELKERTLNIFDEDSRFLIFRPSDKLSEEDYGWFIMRGVDKVTKERLLKKIGTDRIIEIGESLVTSTSINEQNEKSYYACGEITDTVLYPEEKQSMTFELLS